MLLSSATWWAIPGCASPDVRSYLGDQRRGREEYARGHLPGAVFVDLDHELAASTGPGRHPLPDPTAFADRMGQLGFGDEHAIVAYDGASGMVAARLWWMLTDLGRHDVAVLDGGLQAWLEAGGELTPILPTHLRTTLTVSGRWSRTIDRQAILDHPQAFDLVDVRAPERYRGGAEPVDRESPGISRGPATSQRPRCSTTEDGCCRRSTWRSSCERRAHALAGRA